MTDTRDDGGPAMPLTVHRYDQVNGIERHEGLSVRDWFAGQAIAGLTMTADPDLLAREAYRLADAMLRARKEP